MAAILRDGSKATTHSTGSGTVEVHSTPTALLTLTSRMACPPLSLPSQTMRPFSSQTVRWAMAQEFVTKNVDFYVRNHAPVPDSLGDEHELFFTMAAPAPRKAGFGVRNPQVVAELERFKAKAEAGGARVSVALSTPDAADDSAAVAVLRKQRPLVSTTVGDLRKHRPFAHITSVMQCAGNRGKQMIDQNRPTAFSGTPFDELDVGMMGNAVWSGPRLWDVLKSVFPDLATLPQAQLERLHVQFEAADEYSSSTPLSVIADPTRDVILALDMNGQPLPPDHGAPIRVVLPGIAGARNVKWVNSITIRSEQDGHCWNQVFYRDAAHAGRPAIQELPMQSVVTSLAEGQAVLQHELKVTGTKCAACCASVAPECDTTHHGCLLSRRRERTAASGGYSLGRQHRLPHRARGGVGRRWR